ncbi:hypothetical protein IAT40_004884 [Kwoniella sp. CBS 6097]
MSIQLPTLTPKTPYDLLQSLAFSPSLPFAPISPCAGSSAREEGNPGTRYSERYGAEQGRLDPNSKREAPPPIILTSPPVSPKSAPVPVSAPTSAQAHALAQTLTPVLDSGEDKVDPRESLAAFKFPGSYAPAPASSSSPTQQRGKDISSEIYPTSFRLPGSYTTAPKLGDNHIDGELDHGIDHTSPVNENVESGQDRVMVESSRLELVLTTSGTPMAPKHRRALSAASIPRSGVGDSHRRLTPIEARQLATYLTQQFSLQPKRDYSETTRSSFSTSTKKKMNNAQKQKGMMEKSIESAEILHEAGIRWDKSRRVMGTHLRGIWEAAGGSPDLDTYVQGSFLTIAEEPHPLDDAPIPIPMEPVAYAPLPKLSIQAGLFSALPVSISRESSPNPLLSIPLSGSSVSTSMLIADPHPHSDEGLGLGLGMGRRKSFNGFRLRSKSKSHGSRASISSFISVAASACAPRPESTSPHEAAHFNGTLGVPDTMEIKSDSSIEGRSRASSVASSLGPLDPLQDSLSSFRFPRTGDTKPAPAFAAASSALDGRANHRSSVSMSVTTQQSSALPISMAMPAFELHQDLGKNKEVERKIKKKEKRWSERKMNIGLQIMVDGHHRSGRHHHAHSHSHTATSAHSALSTSFPHYPRGRAQPHTATHPPGNGNGNGNANLYVYTPYTAHSRTFYPRTPLTGYPGTSSGGMGLSHRWTSTKKRGYKLPLYIDFKVGKKRFVLGRKAHRDALEYGSGYEGGGWITPGPRSGGFGAGGGDGGGGRGRGKGKRPRSARRVSFGGYEVR